METTKDKETSEMIGKMTERQQIEYLKQITAEPNKPELKTEVLDYHRYFLYKKKQRESKIAPEILENREKMLQLCKKTFTPITKNIYIENLIYRPDSHIIKTSYNKK